MTAPYPSPPAPRFASTPRPTCPDCGAAPGPLLGRFTYYATQMKLLPCPACGLWWVSALLDKPVLDAHFESAYKNDGGYYTRRRLAIFRDLVAHISRLTPSGGTVLDVGGAMGHLLAQLWQRRPDLSSTLTDRSWIAVRAAQSRGFRALHLAADELTELGEQFDTIVLSDVLYYVPNLSRFWAVLRGLVRPGGAIILRVPNKHPLIRLRARPHDSEIPFFNVEHLYVLTPDYLERRLKGMGFAVRHYSSPLLRGMWTWGVAPLADLALAAVARLTRGRLVLSPSRVVTAIGRPSPEP